MADERSIFERLDSIESTGLANNKMLSDILNILKQEEQKNDSQAVKRTLKREPTQKELFQQFVKRSKKSWGWFGSFEEFSKKKRIVQISFIFLIVFGIISTLVTSISTKIYTTFTFLENVFLIFGTITFVYLNKAEHLYEIHKFVHNSSYKFKSDEVGLLVVQKEKVAFVVFRWIGGISAIANIIYIWVQTSSISVVATIFELLFLVAVILSSIAYLFFFTGYVVIYVEGENPHTKERVAFVHMPASKGLITEEEFLKMGLFSYK